MVKTAPAVKENNPVLVASLPSALCQKQQEEAESVSGSWVDLRPALRSPYSLFYQTFHDHKCNKEKERKRQRERM